MTKSIKSSKSVLLNPGDVPSALAVNQNVKLQSGKLVDGVSTNPMAAPKAKDPKSFVRRKIEEDNAGQMAVEPADSEPYDVASIQGDTPIPVNGVSDAQASGSPSSEGRVDLAGMTEASTSADYLSSTTAGTYQAADWFQSVDRDADVLLAQATTGIVSDSAVGVGATGASSTAEVLGAAAASSVSAGAVVAAAAFAAVVIGSSNSNSTTPVTPSKIYSIGVTFGPQTDAGEGTIVSLYKFTGEKLGVATYNATTKRYEYTDTSGYAGVVIAQMVDTDLAPDYMDEATGAEKNAAGAYLVVANVSASGTASLNINPLTTAAAIKMGVQPTTDLTNAESKPTLSADITSGKTTSADITSVNQAMGKAFGLVDAQGKGLDIATIEAPKAVVDITGAKVQSVVDSTDTASAYGRALAIISQAEQASGLTTSQLAEKVATSLDTTTGALTNTSDATTTGEVQNAIVKGIASAQADGQVTTAQAQTVTKAATAAVITLGVHDKGNDTYLNAAETDLLLEVNGSFVAGQNLKLLSGTTEIAYKVVAGSTDTDVTDVEGYTFITNGDKVVLKVAKSTFTDNAAHNLKVELSTGTSTTPITTSSSNILPVVLDSTAPTFSSGATPSVDENVTTSTASYTAIATDLDQSVGVLYSLKTGGDDASFKINAITGAVTFIASPDYEAIPAKTSYTFTVVATDKAGNTAEKGVTLSVNDLNDNAPVFTSGAAGTAVAENAATSTVVYTAASTDADSTAPNQGVVYSLKAATGDADLLSIDNDGKVTLKASADYETKPSYSFTVVATNTGVNGVVKTTEQAVTVNVTDVNEAPTAIALSAASSNSAEINGTGTTSAATKLADITVTDDALGTNTITLTGADKDKFELVGTALYLKSGVTLDYETASNHQYKVTVNVADSTVNGSAAQTVDFTLNLTDVNDAPTASSSIGAQTAVTGQSAWQLNLAGYFADVDATDTRSYALTAGTLPTGLTLNPTSGVISGTPSADTASGNYTVTMTDKGNQTVSQSFDLQVVSAPVVQSFTVSDATVSGTNTATLGKSGEALTFVVTLSESVTTTGPLTAVFTVNGTEVTATAAAVTSQSTITFTGASVPATGDGTAISLKTLVADTGAITGNVSSQPLVVPTPAAITTTGYMVDNTNPTITTSTLNVDEKATAVGSLVGSDTNGVTWTLDGTSGDNDKFSLVGGALAFVNAPDFEAPGSAATPASNAYTVNVKATDGAGNVSTKAITVNVNDVNEAPTVTSTQITDVGAVTGTVYTIQNPLYLDGVSANISSYFTDPDTTSNFNTLAYSLDAGAPLWLNIDPTTGKLYGTAPSSAASDLAVTVKANDGANTVSKTFNIDVVSLPKLATTQSLDGVTNLDVRSALVIAFDQNIALGNGKIKIFDDANGTGWSHKNWATGETVVDTSNNDIEITLSNGSVTAVSIAGNDISTRFNLAASVTVNGTNLVVDLKQLLSSGPGASAGNTNTTSTTTSITRTAFDWDFGSDYHVQFDAGIVRSSTNASLTNLALSDAITLNFKTVTPTASSSAASAAAESQIMDATGESAGLSAGMSWISGNQSEWTSAARVIDMLQGSGSIAVVMDSNGSTSKSGGLSGNVQLNNFNIDDLLYLDNHGDMTLLTTNGLGAQNAANWAGGSQRTLTNTGSVSGSTYLTMFSDAGTTAVTTSLGDSGIEAANKFGTHVSRDLVIFG